ncbi:hypothetical protein U14_02218 [Candidatus Moduliflexus flocculans]|uniref:Roadblock/LAMTOR2 domain-containing protein n=1 Tax=Candidatus Moduliflexus flocculans TaxID=1499966 RepID=A0A0S6VU33_9BACT|nr:hypothetical protein U14_02218 [Candidatus Moduliflexus flocculans]
MFQELQQILHDLHQRIEGLEELVVLQQDGSLLAERHTAEDSATIRTASTAFAALASQMYENLGRGSATEAIIRGKDRFLAIYSMPQDRTFLAIVGSSSVNFGLLNSGGRITIKKIHELLSKASS